MSQQVRSHVARSVNPSEQGITASALPVSSIPVLDDPTRREDELCRDLDPTLPPRSEMANRDEYRDKQIAVSPADSAATLPSVRHRTKPIPKSVDRTLMISQAAPSSSNPTTTAAKMTWTQQQQKQLEAALNQVPKGASDRWDRIAELVSDRTKVLRRIKLHGFWLGFVHVSACLFSQLPLVSVLIRDVPDFGSGRSGIWPFWQSGQVSLWPDF